jgi:hypothetical protein
VDLIDVNDQGRMCPSVICIGSGRERVKQSIERYGPNLPGLVEARERVMREIVDLHSSLNNVIDTGCNHPAAADELDVDGLICQMRKKALRKSPYSKAARPQRAKLGHLGTWILSTQPEEA